MKDIYALAGSEDSMMIPLVLAFIDEFDEFEAEDGERLKCLHWDPQTIADELTVKGVPPNQGAFDRLMCGILILTTDRFENELPVFIDCCNAIAGGRIEHDLFDPADPAECTWTITEFYLLDPPDDPSVSPFSDDIKGYLSELIQYEGLISPPPIMATAAGDRHQKAELGLEYDPVMHAAAYQIQQERTEDLNSWLRTRMVQLKDQIANLQLKHGDAKTALAGLLKLLN